MGSEDMIERKPANNTPTIALGIAAVLLLIVGAMSYKDFVRRSLEKEYAEKEKSMMERIGYVPVGSNNTPYIHQSQLNQQPQAAPAVAPAVTVAQNPVTPQVTQAPPPVAGSDISAIDPQRFPAETNLPRPLDPDIEAMQNSLNQVKRQAAATVNRYGELTNNTGTALQNSGTAIQNAGNTAAEITEELPDFLRNATADPPGGNPEVEARIARLKRQVVASPALAKVISYDKSWGILVFNAGSASGVAKDQRFAVRRGDAILGWVTVDEVEEGQSIARLVTKNRDSDTDLKPAAGDDLISLEL